MDPNFDFSIFRSNPDILIKEGILPEVDYQFPLSKIFKILELQVDGILTREQTVQILKTIETHKSSFKELMKATTSDPVQREVIVKQFKEYNKQAKETIASLPDVLMEYFDKNPGATAKDAIAKYYDTIKDFD
jgi:hypothetical protein